MRTFRVLIHTPARKKPLSLPCAGLPEYSGEQALRVMEDYHRARPMLRTEAVTRNGYTHKGFEVCDLAEMRLIFGDTTA